MHAIAWVFVSKYFLLQLTSIEFSGIKVCSVGKGTLVSILGNCYS